ncbi:MAG: flagellar biosynthesis protein FlhA [Alphaproteobacteria bacterium]|nr:flagellar biosynthesis protein FlhA [Alphaproteobacteria bacterium]
MAGEAAGTVAAKTGFGGFKKLTEYRDTAFAIGILGILCVLLIPVPKQLLDLLLAVSITASVVILMTVLFISRALDLSSFPTILLVTTILRLSLNIASTRLILRDGHTGSDAAGHVIEAFGKFVIQGSVVIGAIVFLILTIINFVVITKGSGRIAEVAARFSLDAMPGKQMAIDADLSAGLIDEQTAKSRRKELEEESTFFGSMDGASKFVRGDAIAGLLITGINLIAGIVIGVVQRDMDFHHALESYTLLTIGDGLVAQIPALIVSMAAGLLVAKAGVAGTTERAIFGQLSNFPKSLAISSGLLFTLAVVPGIPSLPFLILSLMIGSAAWKLRGIDTKHPQGVQGATKDGRDSGLSSAATVPGKPGAAESDEPVSQALHIDMLRLELGYGLLPLIHYAKGHKLTEQIKALRKQMARDYGFVMPSVRIQDNMQMASSHYAIRLKDIICGEGTIEPDKLLVMDPTGAPITLPGNDTKEPAFGLPAKWVAEHLREDALFKNLTVVDPPTVITTHLTEIIKENITDLLTYSATQRLLDELAEEHQKLVGDTVPSRISVSGVQRVLQNLLSELISIRDLPTILEALAEATRTTQNITLITEHVRSRLARQISASQTSAKGYIPIIALSPEWEQAFMESLMAVGDEKQLSMAPSKLQEFIAKVRKVMDEQSMKGEQPILLTNPATRPYVRSVVERFRAMTSVLSQQEIHPKAKIKILGQV